MEANKKKKGEDMKQKNEQSKGDGKGMRIKTFDVEFVFEEEVLATCPGDPEIASNFVAGLAPDAKSLEEEIEAIGVDAVIEKGKTIFQKDESGNPFAWDYQIKGLCKDYCSMLRRVPGSLSKDLQNYKKVVDGLIFAYPRKIYYVLPEAAKIGNCQRPIRVQTAQGERVSVANSETVPAGTKIDFQIEILDPGLEKFLVEWFEYGSRRGFAQWRNSGKGRFTYSMKQKAEATKL